MSRHATESPVSTVAPAPVEAALADRISPPRFHLWFPPNARFVWLGNELVVAARNDHFREWATEKFGQDIRGAAADVAGGPVPVRFVTDPALFAGEEHPAVD